MLGCLYCHVGTLISGLTDAGWPIKVEEVEASSLKKLHAFEAALSALTTHIPTKAMPVCVM